jgi:hypothetical protein
MAVARYSLLISYLECSQMRIDKLYRYSIQPSSTSESSRDPHSTTLGTSRAIGAEKSCQIQLLSSSLSKSEFHMRFFNQHWLALPNITPIRIGFSTTFVCQIGFIFYKSECRSRNQRAIYQLPQTTNMNGKFTATQLKSENPTSTSPAQPTHLRLPLDHLHF